MQCGHIIMSGSGCADGCGHPNSGGVFGSGGWWFGVVGVGVVVVSDGEGRNYSSSSPPALPQSTQTSHPLSSHSHPFQTSFDAVRNSHLLRGSRTVQALFQFNFNIDKERGSFQNQGPGFVPHIIH